MCAPFTGGGLRPRGGRSSFGTQDFLHQMDAMVGVASAPGSETTSALAILPFLPDNRQMPPMAQQHSGEGTERSEQGENEQERAPLWPYICVCS